MVQPTAFTGIVATADPPCSAPIVWRIVRMVLLDQLSPPKHIRAIDFSECELRCARLDSFRAAPDTGPKFPVPAKEFIRAAPAEAGRWQE
ncbi:hypothetical protein GCM10009854_10790 [Saccharopolyspora halophila]|uniref:Uncharacterized protein n=1 Tax=Saccharopolyspora halophila TaxID=405551 RepID=A0ABN3FSZ3_9PSEU